MSREPDQLFIPGTEPPPDPDRSPELDAAVHGWLDSKDKQRAVADRSDPRADAKQEATGQVRPARKRTLRYRAATKQRDASRDFVRERALYLLRLRASAPVSELLSEIGHSVDGDGGAYTGQTIALALAAVRVSLEAGNWREVAAEAAQKLADGWTP